MVSVCSCRDLHALGRQWDSNSTRLRALLFGSPRNCKCPRNYWTFRTEWKAYLELRLVLRNHPHKPESQHTVSETLANNPELNTVRAVAEWHSQPITALAYCLQTRSTGCRYLWGLKKLTHILGFVKGWWEAGMLPLSWAVNGWKLALSK